MTHHWEALGWTLIHFCWQAATIALVYKLADLWMGKGRTQARYVLALAALLGMLVASMGTLAYEESVYRQAATMPAAGISGAKPSLQIIPRPLAVIDMPAAPRATAKVLASDVMPYLDFFWLVGVACLSIKTIGGWWLIRRLRHSALQKAPHTLRIGLDRIRLQMGIPRFVDLRLSSRIAGPLTVGVIRPLILLPVTALTSLSPEQLEVVLAHELAHIRRADYFWNILQTMIETLFFFHPAVWWLSHRLREQRELCCDDIAVETCHDPAVYATALLRLEEQRKTHLHLAMALDGNQGRLGLRARVLRILGDAEEQPRDLKPLSLAGMAALLVLFICPLPQVFASFKSAPKVSASILHAVQKTVRTHAAVKAPAIHTSVAAAASTSVHAAKAVLVSPDGATLELNQSATPAPSSNGKSDYIDQMRAAGYNVDLDKYIAMKTQDITPQYAEQMAKATGQRPSVDDLIALKVQDVTPDYIARMRAAGYNGDLHKIIAMKVQDITPEYADAMAKATGEKPNVDELIALKVQDVTPDYMAGMRAAGYNADLHKLIAMKVQDVTPEYADAMAKVGFGKPSVDDLIALKVQGVSPDYAAKLHADGIEASSFHDLISYRIFNVTPEFVAGMKEAGFSNIPAKKLLSLRVQGVTPEYAKSIKAQFPDATVEELEQMRIFNINADFIASAKRHGFTPLTIQKLVKLRISGILDDSDQAKENQQ
ncbi:M56 family metallopeptidase [Alloacidobacterium dinghuense]|uniref:M56 family metallopeptidase n=1 Tax=Alloacidobacterium dinghuense TaxID=2763107 RepID=A0A7G8BLB6_9BACT|nr:M56 family metallopeptidase [Alloacidobacterium dinghuense]QNI33336.1 M56 family metallopeptidase [Alloacidobacterium dinghuense]